MKKSGLADSPFFAIPQQTPEAFPTPLSEKIEAKEETKQVSATVLPDSRSTEVPKYDITELPNYQTAAVRKSTTQTLDDLSDYPLVDFRQYERVDVRLTWDQKKYLDELEALIARQSPGVEKKNPLSKRITRSSVVRALIEIAKRLEVSVDPSQFQNERHLVKALTEALKHKFCEDEA